MVQEAFDTIVIGGGHNGLVSAVKTWLKAGQKVLVLEAKDGFGGAAVNRSFAPGYNVSAQPPISFICCPKNCSAKLKA